MIGRLVTFFTDATTVQSTVVFSSGNVMEFYRKVGTTTLEAVPTTIKDLLDPFREWVTEIHRLHSSKYIISRIRKTSWL